VEVGSAKAKTVLLAVLVLVAAVCAGCEAAERARFAQNARGDLLGLTRDDLIACAGEPFRVTRIGDREMMTYIADQVEDASKGCVGTFVLRRNLVERLDFTSPAGRLPKSWSVCADIVADCSV